jgi:radical SAM superfamily enzyme YgiQ (UPF0313 family)
MKKKVYYIQPSYRKMDGKIVKGWTLFNSSINIPLFSAANPPGWEKELCDEHFHDINYNTDASVVFITQMGYDILHGIEVAEKFKKLGKILIFGLHRDSFSDELFKRTCDAVFYGVPDSAALEQILDDVINNRLQKQYNIGVHVNYSYDYSMFEGLNVRHLPIQASVGCAYNCDYCCLNAVYGGRYFLKPIKHVIAEMKSIRKYAKVAAFKDPNFYNNKSYVRKLCTSIIQENIGLKWGGHSTINIGDDKETLDLMYKAGCRMLLIGLETLSQANLDAINKPFNSSEYIRLMRNIQNAGVHVVGYFMLGFDNDDKDTFDEVFSFIRKSKMRFPLINMVIPIPGTNLFNRLLKEGRMKIQTADDFAEQNPFYSVPCNYCFFTPHKMTEDELINGYTGLYRKLTRYHEIIKRSRTWDITSFIILLKFNLDLRKEYRKLIKAKHLSS